jgi:two-component sensor histidine kinase
VAPAPSAVGLGTRLMRGLAAQLRGRFQRGPRASGSGTLARLRFPAADPGASQPNPDGVRLPPGA